jgi:hypothetical protein
VKNFEKELGPGCAIYSRRVPAEIRPGKKEAVQTFLKMMIKG